MDMLRRDIQAVMSSVCPVFVKPTLTVSIADRLRVNQQEAYEA